MKPNHKNDSTHRMLLRYCTINRIMIVKSYKSLSFISLNFKFRNCTKFEKIFSFSVFILGRTNIQKNPKRTKITFGKPVINENLKNFRRSSRNNTSYQGSPDQNRLIPDQAIRCWYKNRTRT